MRDRIAIDLRKTCIVGAGGLGKCAMNVALYTRSLPVVLDDKVTGVWVRGTLELLKDKKFVADHKFVVAIGDNEIRSRIYRDIEEMGGGIDRLMHPNATFKPQQIGDGCIILPGVVVGPDATIGRHVILGNCVSVAHDCLIGEVVNICDGAVLGGGVRVDDHAFIGLNTTILPKVRIRRGAIIGAGSIVLSDVAEGETVYGNPARSKCSPLSDPSTQALPSLTPTSGIS